MKKLHLIGLALVAVFAFSAVVAAAASAAPEWLVAGAAVTSALNVETKGALLLTDLKASFLGASSVECTGTFVGTINSGGKDTVTEIIVGAAKSKGNGLTGVKLECPGVKGCEGTGSVYPIGLPWTTQLELSGTTIVDDTTSAGGHVGYVVECSIFGIKEEDECVQTLASSLIENMTSEKDVLGTNAEENTGECSLSKEKSGDISGSGLITTVPAETLEVSGE